MQIEFLNVLTLDRNCILSDHGHRWNDMLVMLTLEADQEERYDGICLQTELCKVGCWRNGR